MWMISYSYRPRYKRGVYIHFPMEDSRTIVLTDQHPAKYIAEHARNVDENKEIFPGNERLWDEIVQVHWSIEVPHGLLTDEEREAFE